MAVVDDNGQWRMFNSAGLAGSGTWSWGCPAVAAASLPSAFEAAIPPKK
jgi:hypothetical protein